MPRFHRCYVPDALIFVTCVTYQRIHYLGDPENIALFWQTLKNVQRIKPFHLLAYVIMPDHFHWIMHIENEADNFSSVMLSIKWNFTRNFKKMRGIQDPLKIWQNRFWDHIIRNEKDLENHFDYIHWNPVKHGLVQFPEQWKESTFTHWAGKGYYGAGWEQSKEPENITGMRFE